MKGPIKIRKISISNYKGIKELDLDFPKPRMETDPDIMVLGSENGIGKTSIIECCSLLLNSLMVKTGEYPLINRRGTLNIPDLLIRAGEDKLEIKGTVVYRNKNISLNLTIKRNGSLKVENNSKPWRETEKDETDSITYGILRDICGISVNPVLENLYLLFHSYRKVQEGNPELGMMIDDTENITTKYISARYRHRYEMPMSAFKIAVLKSMMSNANLFETNGNNNPKTNTIHKLNFLVKQYADGMIDKLRPEPDNTIDVRIKHSEQKETYSFDGLSSGQKEIISTLFLIWQNTIEREKVVFIDEPELHLNAQWHRNFINSLIELAPNNQYIIATHSETIIDSVGKDRCLILYNTL
ncbi:AAA family ATPase [Sedimentisphaera salicampi]|uniref:Putative ATP-binding protein involved in virulence n=1 Tax=Sedimentisphaera salicampi TaxID=1941349 RepID=A0A1W6LN08_9BACT|nr:AAA family ATPase [Sedimentisphaera salicampi]ARN57136.1 putative ATP-binding protein involved in virulence [Sedimentisphaera salicampi]